MRYEHNLKDNGNSIKDNKLIDKNDVFGVYFISIIVLIWLFM